MNTYEVKADVVNKDVHLQVKLCLKCEVLQKECNINPLTFIFLPLCRQERGDQILLKLYGLRKWMVPKLGFSDV